MPADGIHSVTVPGAVDGWAKMHQRYGKLPWKDLFQSAIAYAEQGFPVTEAIAGILGRRRSVATICKPTPNRARVPARRQTAAE